MIRSWKLVALVSMLVLSSVRSSEAWHHGCGFGSGYHSTWGAYGMGGGFRTSSFGSCFTPSYSFSSYCAPRVSWSLGYNNFCSPNFVSSCRPTICAPRYYSVGWCPTTCWTPPTYVYRSYSCYPFFAPPVYSSWSYSSCYPLGFGYSNVGSYSSFVNNANASRYSALAADLRKQAGSSLVLDDSNAEAELPKQPGSTLTADVHPAARAARLEPTATSSRASASLEAKSSKQESWLVLAVELIDSMAQKGGVGEGLAACEQLMSVKPKLSSEIYWRAAILSSLAGRDSKQVARYIELADRTGERFSPSVLPGGSMRAYVARIPGQSLDNALNRHARTALTGDRPTDAYLVLAAFLKQDGQSQRAEKFALAAKGQSLPAATTQERVLLTATEKSAR